MLLERIDYVLTELYRQLRVSRLTLLSLFGSHLVELKRKMIYINYKVKQKVCQYQKITFICQKLTYIFIFCHMHPKNIICTLMDTFLERWTLFLFKSRQTALEKTCLR